MAARPTPSERETYRRPFFIVSLAIAASMAWLLYQEGVTRRPWKDVQLRGLEVERARLETNLAGERQWLAEGKVKRTVDGKEEEVPIAERVKALEARLTELAGGGEERGELAALEKALGEKAARQKERETELAFRKADEDEAYYRYRDAKHHGRDVAALEEALERAEHAVAEATKAADLAAQAADAVADELGQRRREETAVKKELAEYVDGVSAWERAVAATAKRFSGVEAVLSGDGRIEQLWNPEIGLVDRCHTCHVGFDKCGFTRPKEIVEGLVKEPLPADAVRARFCLTRQEAERYVAAAAKIKDSWGSAEELTFEKLKGDLALDDEPLATAAKKLAIPMPEAEALYRTHPRQRELLGAHPPERFGCTTCHYGEGPRTKGAGLNYLAGESAPFDHARRDRFWELQMLDTKTLEVEASCFNCHKDEYELPGAERLTRGKKLADHLGCNGCHPLGAVDPIRKAGPTLTKVAGKVDPAWLVAWIQAPRALRPHTAMPGFWPSTERCDTFEYTKGSPFAPARYGRCEDVREEESVYIAAYLLDRSSKRGDVYPERPATADAERGKALFSSIGCMGCHNLGTWTGASKLPGSPSRDLAPNLTGIGDKVKTPGWFYAWLRDPRSYWSETRMPSLRLSEGEAWDLAAYLGAETSTAAPTLSERTKARLGEAGAADKGKKLIAYYGCFGCHEIEGFEGTQRVGVDLTEFGSKLPAELDFGDVKALVSDPKKQTWASWTRTKLEDPRAFRYERSSARMPQHDLAPEELADLMIFLRSQNTVTKRWPSSIRHAATKGELATTKGARLVDDYNCTGCHVIDDRGIDVDGDHVLDGGELQRFLAEAPDDLFRAPPKLIREGAKVYPDWLYAFLKAPSKLRENYQVRMPTFQLSDDEATALVEYFAVKANKPFPFMEKRHDVLSREDQATAEKLFTEAQCLTCHNLGDTPPSDPKNVSPNLRLTAERLQYDWLYPWFLNPQEQAPGVGMPNFFIPIEDKPGTYETPLTDIAGGDAKRQIELLRAFVIELGLDPKKGRVK